MTISSVKGMSVNTPLRRSDAVLPERSTVPELTRRFRDRLENANGGYRSGPPTALDRRVTGGPPGSGGPRQPRRNTSAPTAMTGRGTPGAAAPAAHEQPSSPSASGALRRTQRTRKRLPRGVRETVRKMVPDLTVVDVWSDPAEKAVTLLVEQDGWEDAEITVKYQESDWRLLVRTITVREAERFQQAQSSLQRFFDEAELGRVTLSCIGEGA